MLSFRSARPVLHDLLVFGSFILEPYLHLDIDLKKKKTNKSIKKTGDNNEEQHCQHLAEVWSCCAKCN